VTVDAIRPTTAMATEPSLVDLLDRLLGKGIVISGDVVISLADVDLVSIRLSAIIQSAPEEMKRS
jgi:hypothetical protein